VACCLSLASADTYVQVRGFVGNSGMFAGPHNVGTEL